MKKAILFTALMLMGMSVSAKKKKDWQYSDGNLEKVFIIEASSSSNEILRLYDDGTYEHLKYTAKRSGKEQVLRSLGNYQIDRSKITFDVPNEKEFSGKFKYGTFFYNGKLYHRFIDMKLRKSKGLFKIATDKKFFKPFFICLNSDEVVFNRESGEQIDLQRLIEYILKDKENEEDKVMAIIQLIVGSVEYDYDGFLKNIYANNQNDAKSILAGNKRLAVCAGYAYTVKLLCEMAGLKAEQISGHTKQSFSDLKNLGGYHAWNLIEIEGEKRLYDVTWADNGKTINMSWIDVNPLVMIGTHFPDIEAHQLLAKPISQNQFLNAAIVNPISSSASAVFIPFTAQQFVENNFTFALPGKHTIKVSKIPSEMANRIYADEVNNRTKTYSPMLIGSGHYDGDSTYFSVPLNEVINPLSINIDGQLKVSTVVFNGSQTDLMNHYIKNVNRRHSDSYVKGVIAAIRLNDFETLKQLVGEDNPVFFDRKGKLKLDRNIVISCLDWTGDLTSLTRTKRTQISLNNDMEYDQIEEVELHIDIPNKLQLTLEFDGEFYTVVQMEVL